MQDPTDAGKNYKKANREERKLKKWVERVKKEDGNITFNPRDGMIMRFDNETEEIKVDNSDIISLAVKSDNKVCAFTENGTEMFHLK